MSVIYFVGNVAALCYISIRKYDGSKNFCTILITGINVARLIKIGQHTSDAIAKKGIMVQNAVSLEIINLRIYTNALTSNEYSIRAVRFL